ncbi:uncharacterized protein F5147DRAFT_660329 [Suillus discolor]|uniref:Uncharacterized protein n=1 Tax=Suillus discolor TaxID=1912936 RepID=A0A9P7EQB6_9AGAM|nr:uncharacterized protein F5147DRAFT_660329 [Suillus discolor]KAG2082971.1 hypothetical protein F5147DRAFT_660329 [Suillus discolor]
MPRTQSPIVLSQQKKVHLDKAEVLVLRDHLEDWRSVKGKERSRVLIAIYKEASLQAPTKDRAILKARKKIYKQWLQNQSRRKKDPKPLIKYGRRWTARKVLIQTHKHLIREETGEMAGSEEMISKWPRAAKSVIDGLSAEEREQAAATAEKWNHQAAPPEVQAEVAESKGAEMIEHLTTEMFKQAGMRVCVLSAWNNSKGKLMLGGHDFNEQFGNGESFIKTRDWDGMFMLEWGEYAGEQFDAEDAEEPRMVKSKKRQPQKLIELEEDADGWLMLPDTMGWNCAKQQHMIRSFLTKLYRMCGGEDTSKSAVPWGNVSQDPLAYFDGTKWPAGMQFKEPSKMDISDTSALLQFWFAWQEQNIQPAFSFMVWQDSDSDICEAVVSPAPRQAAMNRNRTQRTQPKGKYTGNPLPSHRAIKESSSEDELYGNDGHSSSEGDEPLFTAQKKDVTPPRQATLPTNKPRKLKSDAAPPRRSAWQTLAAIGDVPKPAIATFSNTKEPAIPQRKAAKQPSRSSGAVTRRKEVTYVANDQPRGSKCCAPEAVRDTPVKRTRSKTCAPEASLGRRSKK